MNTRCKIPFLILLVAATLLAACSKDKEETPPVRKATADAQALTHPEVEAIVQHVRDSVAHRVDSLTQLAESNHAEAQYELGRYYSGINDTVNRNKWWEQAAANGYEMAQVRLLMDKRKYHEVIPVLSRLAEEGDAEAQAYLGYCYYYGLGVELSYVNAVEWYAKAAEQGNARAQSELGWCYYNGRGVEQSYEKVVEWYTEAAEQGHAWAQWHLGKLYAEGRGVDKSYAKAAEWYTKAAAQGDYHHQIKLGDFYVDRNSYEKALAWYAKAGIPRSMCEIGGCYYMGRGVEQSYEKAVAWYTKAAEEDYPDAQNNLGECYYYGHGVEQSYEKAVEWVRKAAKRGNKDALYNLGWCYEHHEGVTESWKIVDWAQRKLGWFFTKSPWVDKNEVTALNYYLKADMKGLDEASEKITELLNGDTYQELWKIYEQEKESGLISEEEFNKRMDHLHRYITDDDFFYDTATPHLDKYYLLALLLVIIIAFGLHRIVKKTQTLTEKLTELKPKEKK